MALIRQRAYGPALGLLHLSLYSARHLPPATVLLLPLCVAALTREAETWPCLRALLDYSERLRAIDQRLFAVVLVVLVLAATFAGLGAAARADRVGFDPARFPARAADFLEQRNPAGRDRVFAKDQWSGYLIYRFEGKWKVFMDGRSDFYGQQFMETYAQVVEVQPGWEAVLRRYEVRYVLAPPDAALASALALSPEWKRVYTDSLATVFERMR